MILSRTPSHTTPPHPIAAIAAPISPPNSACEDEDGMPYSHVNRFHMMAPVSPANTTSSSFSDSMVLDRSNPSNFTMPLATVFATATDRNAPIKLRAPASATAVFGLSAPVAMDVAIAFAVS